MNPSSTLEKRHGETAEIVRENTKLGTRVWLLGEPRNKQAQIKRRHENEYSGAVWADNSLKRIFHWSCFEIDLMMM